MMNRYTTIVAATALSIGAAGSVFGSPEFTLLTDDRGVSANSATSSSDGVFVTDTAVFGMDADLIADANYTGPGVGMDVNGAKATQVSSFLPGAFDSILNTFAVEEIANQFAGAGASSYVDITFSIDQQYDFEISSLVMLDGPFSQFTLLLESDEPVPTEIINTTSGGDFSGLLDAGAYHLRYELSVSGAGDLFFEVSTADVSFRLIPSPGASAMLAPIGLTVLRRRRR